MALAVVQQANGGQSASQTTAAATFGTTTLAGSLLVALVSNNNSSALTSITDGAGNTYVRGPAEFATSHTNWFNIYYCKNATANAGTVTANFSVGVTYAAISVYEITGAGIVAPYDTSATGDGASGTAIATSTLSLAGGSEIILSLILGDASTYTAGTGYALHQFAVTGDTNQYFATEYHIVSANEAASATQSVPGIWSIQAAAFKVNGPALHTVGDSITVGFAASTHANSWSALLAANLGYAEDDRGVSSTQIVDQCTDDRSAPDQVYSKTGVQSGDVFAWLAGYNDMRHTGSDANGIETFKRALRSGVAWLSRGLSDIYQLSNAAWTMSAGWTAIALNGIDTKYTNTNGATATITLTGTAITLAYIANIGTGSGGTCSITIDGSAPSPSTIDTNFGTASGFNNGGAGATRWCPMAIRWGGLSPGTHTLVITTTNTGTVQPAFACGNGETTKPEVRICGPLKETAADYIAFPPYDQGSDAAVALYAAAIVSVCTDAATDGRLVKYADVNLYYDPASDESGDQVHPNDEGHADIAEAFEAAVALGGTNDDERHYPRGVHRGFARVA